METRRIVWFDLSESQKAKVLKQVKTYLQEQKQKQRIRTAFLTKYGIN